MLSFDDKVRKVKERFAACHAPQDVYQQIMAMGRVLVPLDAVLRAPQALVPGCQSQVFLVAEKREGRVYFHASADALISAGLVALLLEVYSGEEAQTILTRPPSYIEELGVPASLTPTRAGGLASMYLHMKRLVVPYLLPK